MKSKFKQIHLADMDYYLGRMLAVIALSPRRIAEATGVVFETAYEEGAGYILAVLMVTNSGKQFSLRQYYQCKGKYPDQTELIGSERSINPAADIAEFIDALGIGSQFLVWKCAG